LQRTVAVFGSHGLKGQADALSQLFGFLVGDAGGMQENHAAAPLQKAVELFITLLIPVMIPEVENDYVSKVPVALLRPFPGGRHTNGGNRGEQFLPTSL